MKFLLSPSPVSDEDVVVRLIPPLEISAGICYYYIINDMLLSMGARVPSCPSCDSEKVIKNGSIHNGKPKFSCKKYRRQFLDKQSNEIILQEIYNLSDTLIIEKKSSGGISRVTSRPEERIENYINKKYEDVPK